MATRAAALRSIGTGTGVAALAVALLTGCGSDSPGQGVGGPTSTGPHSSAPSAYPTATDGPSPDSTQTSALITALTAVDPDLVTDRSQAVTRSVIVCGQLQDGGDAATVVPPAFSDVQLSAQQAQAVAAAIRTSFCPA